VRLAPATWRALDHALGDVNYELPALTPEALDAALLRARATCEGEHWRRPPGASLLVIAAHLERAANSALRRILDRHVRSGEVSPEHPGIPDLCLYRTRLRDGALCDMHFVEVKKQEERISNAQVAEIRFLRGVGLSAGVVRVRDPKPAREQLSSVRLSNRAGRADARTPADRPTS
jgi:hypothetical protein